MVSGRFRRILSREPKGHNQAMSPGLSLCSRDEAKIMDSAKGPTEAIATLLAEDLRRLISALPDDLQESVPQQLLDSTRSAKEKHDTAKESR
jgi:hypothetical protein